MSTGFVISKWSYTYLCSFIARFDLRYCGFLNCKSLVR